jgi:hypothetical protein
MSFLDNYEGVADRIKRFWLTYPTGKIHTSIIDVDITKGYILVECRIFKKYEDEQPAGIDYAFGNVATYNVNMKKWFVEDTVTSAIGRCAGLVLGTDARPTQEKMQQVESLPAAFANAQVDDLWAGPFGDVTMTVTTESGFTTAKEAIADIKAQLGGVQIEAAPICPHGQDRKSVV